MTFHIRFSHFFALLALLFALAAGFALSHQSYVAAVGASLYAWFSMGAAFEAYRVEGRR